MNRYRSALVALVTVLFVSAPCLAAGEPIITFKRNGGWCWFQDDRVIVDGNKIILGTVAGTTRDGSDAGDVEVTSYDLTNGATTSFKLFPKFQADDHTAPALLKMPDGRYMAVWASHGSGTNLNASIPRPDQSMRWRITAQPGDVTSFGAMKTAATSTGISYSNVYRLSAEGGRIYNFHRSVGFDPNYFVSDDGGQSFRYGGRLMSWDYPTPAADPLSTGAAGGGRPYARYASNHTDAIHISTTEDHPGTYANSIYHGYLKGGKLHRSDGAVIGNLSTTETSPISPKDFTKVFQGSHDDLAWTNDIELDASGKPYMGFSVRHGDAGLQDPKARGGDLRYYYARWDGTQWNTHMAAYGGTALEYQTGTQVDYAGLMALDRIDPNTVFISTNADPATGQSLISIADGKRHREIFQGVTTDGGETWQWTALTSNSVTDNFRPVSVALDEGRRAVLWQRGRWTTFLNYSTDIVGVIQTVPEPAATGALGASALLLCRRHRPS